MTSAENIRSHPLVLTAPARGAGGGARKRRRLQPGGLLWIIPALVVSVGLIYYSIGYTVQISTLKWDGISPNPPSIGWDNYTAALADPIFWGSVAHPLIFFVSTFLIQTTIALLFAVLLHSRIRLAAVYKVILFVPVVIAPAVMAPVFRQIFAADGQFNGLLDAVGLGFLTHAWLADGATALWVVISISIWQWTGLTFILYFSAMTQIEPQIIEAARIDGAGNLRMLWSIIVPSLNGTTVAVATLGAISALKTFDIPYLVTGGGPNYATEFLGTYIYSQSIPRAHVGYGAALSVLLIVMSLALAIILNLRTRRQVANDV